jgi:hypothetical protein
VLSLRHCCVDGEGGLCLEVGGWRLTGDFACSCLAVTSGGKRIRYLGLNNPVQISSRDSRWKAGCES